MLKSHTILDLSALPDQARIQLFDFYEFLSEKYNPIPSEEVPTSKMRGKQGSHKGVGTEKKTPEIRTYNDLDELAGTWSDEEFTEFCEATADFGQIDEKLWKRG